VTGDVLGAPLSAEEAATVLNGLTFAGADTTASSLLHTFIWLDEHPDVRARLREDRQLLDHAVDEFLRCFAPTLGTARTVMRPVEVRGRSLQPGDRVILNFVGANRDPEKFDCPGDVRPERENASQHMTFGGGGHRCLGAHLARLEFRLILEEVLDRLPDYRIDRPAIEPYPSIGVVNGFIRVPATFAPVPRPTPEPTSSGAA
jgi:cytochrome P450